MHQTADWGGGREKDTNAARIPLKDVRKRGFHYGALSVSGAACDNFMSCGAATV